ncbi:ORC5 like AAA+ ATpase [Cryptosporidium bovis]|uniref:ORC5 like AAA+ ATpase n=1 Tax=Cryptosporidium bovis TaxID=310047 RepID=UPI00351A2602|nr:ORC5 like AAA+ ATpase [Cryptosporidium bovis]
MAGRRSNNVINETSTPNKENARFYSIESNSEEKTQSEFNELLIKNGLSYYSGGLKSTIYSLCKKYGSSRFHEIFQIANMIGSNENAVPYLQVLGMSGTGKYTLITDFLNKNKSIFGCIDGTYSKWLSNSSKGNTLHKISIDNLFVRPVEQIKKSLIQSGIISGKKKKPFILSEGEDECCYDSSVDVNTLKEFVDELRRIKKKYREYLLQNNTENECEGNLSLEKKDEENNNAKKRKFKEELDSGLGEVNRQKFVTRNIFLVVKDVTTLSKNRPDFLLTLIKLHEHLRETILIPKTEEKKAHVNFSVIFIDNNGIPEDFYCNHVPFPVIWFSAYNDVQCFDVIVNSRMNQSINDFNLGIPNEGLDNNKKYKLMLDSLKESYRKEAIEFVKDNNGTDEFIGIRLLLIDDQCNNKDIESYMSAKMLDSIWKEYVAEMVTVLHPFLKSDFMELLFKIRISWPIFLFPVITGEILMSKRSLDNNYSEYINELIMSLIKRFKRHYNKLKTNIYSHVIPELFQGELLSGQNISNRALCYSFLRDQFRVEMSYFSKLLLVSAYIASKISKKDDKKLFHTLVASKLKTSKSKKRIKSTNINNSCSDECENKPFSLIRWLAIADCIALHITGTDGVDPTVLFFEQINNLVRLGFVIPVNGKWGQMVQTKGCVRGQLFDVSPISELTIGQNMGIEMTLFRQNNIFRSNSSHCNNTKMTNVESLVNMEDPRALYMTQIPESMIETFSMDIGILLKEIIPR